MSRNGSQLKNLAVLLCLSASMAISGSAQTPVPNPVQPLPERTPPVRRPVVKTPVRVHTPRTPQPKDFPMPPTPAFGSTSEKAIAVDANVNIKLPCISQAKVSINGWERDEIRVFVKNGSKISFRVHEKDPASGKPVWVLITGLGENEDIGEPLSECLSGEAIEIDVPVRSTLSISAKNADTNVDSIKKISIDNVDGGVALRNISGGITASTYRGNLSVENSGGQISLETSTGNIVAYGVGPGQIGDTFKVKTSNGAIMLQNVEHRQVRASSISGSAIFSGKFLPGGLYNFTTAGGTIGLMISEKSSCKIIASYGFGKFTSSFPSLKIVTENDSPGGRSLVATMGNGEATVNITTSSGRISLGGQK
jgi:putative adhesin